MSIEPPVTTTTIVTSATVIRVEPKTLRVRHPNAVTPADQTRSENASSLFTKLPWPGHSEMILVFESSCHLSTTHDGDFTLSLSKLDKKNNFLLTFFAPTTSILALTV